MNSQRSDMRPFALPFALITVTAIATSIPAFAEDDALYSHKNLVVSRSVYDNKAGNVKVGQILPPNCTNSCVTATYDGTYPTVWNNNLVDGSFGITSKIFLDQITPSGKPVNSIEVPTNQIVTSFSSKSELALNLSLDRKSLTFMGYVSPINAIDVSNSNTPGVVDPTNPVGENVYRAAAIMDRYGKFQVTATNAYSGNNGRAAILNNAAEVVYMAGNAGNGGTPQPNGIIIAAGAQILTPSKKPKNEQSPGIPTPVASFNITQLGNPPDKIGKDDNFRGLTVFDKVLYYTKGSGGNGVNTVYFVDSTGTVCTDSNGVGLPAAGATLPTAPLTYNPLVLQTKGLDPNNMCVLKGFPTALKSKTSFPFGIWFANATTLYVADEGNGDNTYSNGMYTTAAAQTTAGLQKWVFSAASGKWSLAYTLQAGLNLGAPYTVKNYPAGNNPATGLPWAPGTDGLRNITGAANEDGTVTIYAITSTVSGNGDQGADPDRLVAITDHVAATVLPASEKFTTIYIAGYGEVLRGVSFAPGGEQDDDGISKE
jgi:hypothetical protein